VFSFSIGMFRPEFALVQEIEETENDVNNDTEREKARERGF
jgi:hypothetical protein